MRYFPLTRHYFRPRAGLERLDEMGRQMLEEPAAVYNRSVEVADETTLAERSGVFVREVLRAYQSTCAVSGLQLVSTTGAAWTVAVTAPSCPAPPRSCQTLPRSPDLSETQGPRAS